MVVAGDPAQHTTVNFTQPDARTLVVRWKLRWCALPMLATLVEEMEELEAKQALSAAALQDSVTVSLDPEQVTRSVQHNTSNRAHSLSQSRESKGRTTVSS